MSDIDNCRKDVFNKKILFFLILARILFLTKLLSIVSLICSLNFLLLFVIYTFDISLIFML